jgi:hypothetical protein
MLRIVLCCCIASLSWAQPRLIKSLELSAPVSHVHIDRAGDVYLQFESGKIQKLNRDGGPVCDTQLKDPLTSFDPGNAMRLLGFDRRTGKVTWFYPDLTVYEQFTLDPAFAIEPWLLCTSGERDFWIADAADQSLKKIRTADQTVQREFRLPAGVPPIKQLAALREYQNFLFLLDTATGLYVVNSFGKLIRTLPEKNLNQFQFLGEELFFQRGDELVFFNLFTAELRTLGLPETAVATLLSDERMFLLQSKSLKIFEFTP